MPILTLLVVEDPNEAYLGPLDKLCADTNVVVEGQSGVLEQAAPQADVILCGFLKRNPLRAIFPNASRLQWVHCLSAGVEKILFPELVESSVLLTNARGVYARQLAEFVMAAVLFFAKELRGMVKSQEADLWQQRVVERVEGKVLGIVGYGEIGRSTAQLARALGMRVLGLRRRPELSHGDPLIEHVFAPNRLREMLAASDYVVLSAPNTPESRSLIGRVEIASMKAHAVLINVGRGTLIDEAALADALEKHKIRGAALDVFETEPLPFEHPFYQLENLLLSPHCADHVPDSREQAVEAFVRNFEKFRKGEPLDNIVDKRAGY